MTRSQSRKAIEQHLAYYGPWCPGAIEEDHDPHVLNPDDELTIDHIVPKSQGGTNDWSNRRILCKSWNSHRHVVEQ